MLLCCCRLFVVVSVARVGVAVLAVFFGQSSFVVLLSCCCSFVVVFVGCVDVVVLLLLHVCKGVRPCLSYRRDRLRVCAIPVPKDVGRTSSLLKAGGPGLQMRTWSNEAEQLEGKP